MGLARLLICSCYIPATRNRMRSPLPGTLAELNLFVASSRLAGPERLAVKAVATHRHAGHVSQRGDP